MNHEKREVIEYNIEVINNKTRTKNIFLYVYMLSRSTVRYRTESMPSSMFMKNEFPSDRNYYKFTM